MAQITRFVELRIVHSAGFGTISAQHSNQFDLEVRRSIFNHVHVSEKPEALRFLVYFS